MMDSSYDFVPLEELEKRSEQLYGKVKYVLAKIKDSGSSIIGHPLLRLQNKIISLKYLVLSELLELNSAADLESSALAKSQDYRQELLGYEQEFLDLEKMLWGEMPLRA